MSICLDDQLEPEITQYDEGPVQNSVEEEASDKILKNTKEEDLEEELDNGIDF